MSFVIRQVARVKQAPRSPRSLLDSTVVAAVILGTIAWLMPLMLSAGESFTPWDVRLGWLFTLTALGVLFRRSLHQFGRQIRHAIGRAYARPESPSEVAWRILIVLFATTTLAAALLYPPTVWDSNAHHLPRVAQFMQNQTVDPFPTYYGSMNATYPFSAYVLAQVALAGSGINSTLNLVQWAAYLLVAVLSHGIALELGSGRSGARFSALLALATPTLALQATTTQYDLIVAAWTMCAIYLAMRWARSPFAGTITMGALLGGAAGLALVTKVTSLLILAPFAVWLASTTLRKRQWASGATLAVMALATGTLLALPLFSTNVELGGNVLGTGAAGNTHILVPDRSPAALWMNAARNLSIVWSTPSASLNTATARAAGAIGGALGVGVNEPVNKETHDMVYALPTSVFNPDMAAAPLSALAALIATGILAVAASWREPSARRKYARRALAYECCVFGGMTAIAALVTWQPYIVRTLSAPLALLTPVAGVAFALPSSRGSGAQSAAGPARTERLLRAAWLVLLGTAAVYGLSAVTFSATAPLAPRSVFSGGAVSHGWWNTPYGERGWRAASEFLAPDISSLRELATQRAGQRQPVAVVGGDLAMAVPAYPMIQVLRDAGYVVFYEPKFGPVTQPGIHAELWAERATQPDLQLLFTTSPGLSRPEYEVAYDRTISEIGVSMRVLLLK